VNGSSIFLEFGVPSLPGQFRIYFSLATKIVPELDACSHRFEELFEMPISGELTASQVKVIIAGKLKQLKGMDVDPKVLRLRERISERVCRVYRDIPLKQQAVFEKKQIAVEILDKEDKISPKEALLLVRFWDPEALELSSIIEIVIDKNETLYSFALRLYELDQRIPIENMEAVRIVAIYNFTRGDLLTQEWEPLMDQNNQLYNYPFFISNDGFTIFVKDKTTKVEFTEEDKKKLGILNQKNKKGGGAISYKAAPEKGVTITIKKVSDQMEEEKPEVEKKTTYIVDQDTNLIPTVMNNMAMEEERGDPGEFRPLID
jgi:hypothetical protein